MNLRKKTSTAVIVGAAVLAGYSIVRAGSPFPAGADPPVIFSGVLSDSGVPLSGSQQIALNLWSSSDTSATANLVCTGSVQAVSVVAGQFQLPLDPACANAFSKGAPLWYEIVVNGSAFPVQQVGSVPYAVRTRQPGGGSRLAPVRRVVYGEEGYSETPVQVTVRDTLRAEDCERYLTLEGGQQRERCLPRGMGSNQETVSSILSSVYQDGSCSSPFVQTPGARYYSSSSPPPGGPREYAYAVDFDPTVRDPVTNRPLITALYPATTQRLIGYRIVGLLPPACQPAFYMVEYVLGPAIPFTEFVEMRTVTE